MIKLLLLALLFFLGYSFFQLLFPSRRQPPKSRGYSSRQTQGETMVEDPQCGKYLPVSEAISARVGGQQHYFCSHKCRKEYANKS
jgi:YHS domain-containing protein